MNIIVRSLLVLVLACSALDAQTIYTKRKGNDIREGPGSYYGLILTLPENTKLTVLEKTSSWVKVQLPNNKVGWIASNNLVDRPAGKNIAQLQNVWNSPKASKAGIAAAIKGFGETYGKSDPGTVDRVLASSEKGFVASDVMAFRGDVRQGGSSNRDKVRLADLSLDVPDYDVSLEERQIGVGIAARITSRGLLENSNLQKYVNLICATITESSSIYDKEFSVMVLNDDKVNAFAIPGGYIFVTKGMISICRDEAELAGVIAHEVAHVIRRHGMQEISKRAANIAADNAFSELDEEVGKTDVEVDLEEMIEATYDKVLHPRLIKYELEGDKIGIVLLANAGYDPFGLVRISERIAKLPKEQANIFDANFMAPNGAMERYNAILRFSGRQFKTANPGNTMQSRFMQYRNQIQ